MTANGSTNANVFFPDYFLQILSKHDEKESSNLCTSQDLLCCFTVTFGNFETLSLAFCRIMLTFFLGWYQNIWVCSFEGKEPPLFAPGKLVQYMRSLVMKKKKQVIKTFLEVLVSNGCDFTFLISVILVEQIFGWKKEEPAHQK